MPLKASFFETVPFGGVYIPCIYCHARWSYHRPFRSLLLCPVCTPVSMSVPEMEGIYMPLKPSFFETVPLVEFMYPVFTVMPGGVTVGDLGLRCCVPCLLSAVNPLC